METRSSGRYPLAGTVHVDEFYIGGEEEDLSGRSSETSKKLVVVALGIVIDGGRGAYAQVVDDASSKSFRPFPQMHIHIMNIKGWIRGIHHHCSKEGLQGYLGEYHFRFNRHNNMETKFDVLMRRLINNASIRIGSNG